MSLKPAYILINDPYIRASRMCWLVYNNVLMVYFLAHTPSVIIIIQIMHVIL